ncbi:lytic murein transglycosylase B [Sessilibacter sp. MAH4]
MINFVTLKRGFNLAVFSTALSAAATVAYAGDYSNNPEKQKLVDELVSEYGFNKEQLNAWFDDAVRKDSILKAIARPAEKSKPWKEYRNIFVTESRISLGVDFWIANQETLARAEQTFGVPAEMIVAIIGVETRYGNNTGGYRVIDALSTLAFDYPPRSEFFRKELKEFLLLAREQSKSPVDLTGSYAGAMGYGQFMPSSYRAYAKDFDDDAFIDIWNNPVDAIGSVANYFKVHGWQANQPVTDRVRVDDNFDATLLSDDLKPSRSLEEITQAGFSLTSIQAPPTPLRVFELEGEKGSEFWAGFHNFYVITRYNRSTMYAMAVYQLAEEIKKAKAEKTF